AIRLANQTIGSRPLMRDGEVLAAAIESGQSEITQPMRLLPTTVPAAMNLAARGDELAETLGMLSRMQQEQAELRLQTLPVILAPFLLVLVAGAIGFIILALFAPFI